MRISARVNTRISAVVRPLIALAGLALAATLSASPATSAPDTASDSVSILRVTSADPVATAARLEALGFDLVEARSGNTLLVVGEASVAARLRGLGYAVKAEKLPKVSLRAGADARFYGGYYTADEYVAHLGDVAAARPDLAVTYDVGDSWRKTQGRPDGNDLVAICITKRQPGDCQLTATSAKPRFFLLGTVHARELTATELATRFVDLLTTSYGTDADITSIVDNTEVWVLPLANPDGREIAESGGASPYLQRKNANNTLGTCAVPPTSSNQHGVDINRNFNWQWGGVGTSTDPCAQTFRGQSAASEPETAAIVSLMRTLFPDQRGPAATDAAPLTTPGYMMTLHSYANQVLIPWGDTNTASPNDAGLRSAAFRVNFYNGYQAGQPGQILYNVTGSTDDWLYGERGIASSTMEVGPQSGSCSTFVPAYSCQDTFFNLNRNALLYLAKAARAPYQLTLGPTTTSATVSSASVSAGASVTLQATTNDAAYGKSGVGKPASQRIAAGRYFVDVAPWAGGTGIAMAATDRRFSSTSEGLTATVSTSGWAPGRHTIWVQGQDLSGNWGPATAVFLTVS
ncbi:MAG: M14 family zinc carboxypeptidase [Nocardioides sp.]